MDAKVMDLVKHVVEAIEKKYTVTAAKITKGEIRIRVSIPTNSLYRRVTVVIPAPANCAYSYIIAADRMVEEFKEVVEAVLHALQTFCKGA